MNIIELILDENDEMNGIEAISVVENPAIEEDFVALKSEEIKLAEVDKEKRIRGFYDGTVQEDIDQIIEDIKILEAED